VSAPRAAAPTALDIAAFQPYVLYVGEAERRKGFDTLLAAMASVARRRSDLSLVVTTRLAGWSLPPGLRVHELGYVFAFPSRYEGFGLPVLEAMSYGAPVVASTASAVPEAGGDAACYVAPDDADELAAALQRVLEDDAYARELRRRGPIHAANFTWERTASRTLAVIEATLA
jgi:glycosyltransferase involved in cell wall biosynthesis